MRRILTSSIIISLFIPAVLFADTLGPYSDTVTISATVNGVTGPTNPNPPSTGGGGGGGGSAAVPQAMPTAVNFSGMAYPLSKITILKDGQIAATTIADQAANFSVVISNLSTDTYTFSVYSEDSKGRRSSSFSFPVYVTQGTTVTIGNIFLSPTIDIDKSRVKQGDNLAIFGTAQPDSSVSISIHSDQEIMRTVTSNAQGVYLYNLDTSILNLGTHETKSKARLDTQLSEYTNAVSFIVGNESQIKKQSTCSSNKSDINCDGRVNLVDFSVMAYWFKRSNPPAKVDLNGDGKVTLIDFSILAYHWTG